MVRQGQISLFAAALITVTCATQKMPGTTIASSDAQTDVALSVMGFESAVDSTCKQSRIVNTEVTEHPKDRDKDPWTEKWTVDRCGEMVPYKVAFRPSPSGGTYSVSPWK